MSHVAKGRNIGWAFGVLVRRGWVFHLDVPTIHEHVVVEAAFVPLGMREVGEVHGIGVILVYERT